MGLGDVVDQFLDQNGLAHAGAAEQADLAAPRIGREQIDDLDAGDQDFGLRRLIDEIGRRLVDFAPAGVLTGPASSIGSPMTFMMRPSVSSPTGTEIVSPGIADAGAAGQTFGRVHGDGAHGVLAKVLSNFEHETVAVVVGFERVQDGRQMAVELDVHNGAHNLGNTAGLGLCHGVCYLCLRALRRPK